MSTYFFGIDLPVIVRSRLASLCYGLPYVKWMEEESLSICLSQLGKLNHSQLHEVKQCLAPLFFNSFPFTLHGVDYESSTKGKQGSLFLGTVINPSLEALKNEVDFLLKGLGLPTERNKPPYILLGNYDRLNPDKLRDYLLSYEGFQFGPFEATSCSLLSIRSTPKNLFIERIGTYPASPKTTGED